MASQLSPLDEEQQGQMTSTQSGLTGGGTNMSGGPAAGTGWTNLNQYLDANQGAGEQIANAAVQETGNQFASDKSAIDSWSKGLQDQLGAQKQADTTKAGEFKSGVTNAGQNFGQAAQQQSFDAWKKASSPASQFESNSGYQDAYGAQSRIKDNMSLIKDPTSQSKIVADTFRKQQPTYSQGMANLDTFLATADGGNSLNKKLQGLASQYSGDYLGDSKTAYGTGVQDLESTMGKNREDVMGAIANQYGALKSQADQGTSFLNNQNTRTASQDAMSRFGADTQGMQDASYADVLDQNQLADLEALSALSGQQFDGGQKNKTYSQGKRVNEEFAPVQRAAPAPTPEGEMPEINADPLRKTQSGAEKLINSAPGKIGATFKRWGK